MATDTLSAADAILKEFYVGPVVEQLNKKTFMIDRIERDTTQIDFTGRRAIVPVEKARNRGRGSRGDGGTLPVAGTDSELDAIIPIRYHYQGVELTDALIEQTQSNQGAFINALDSRVKNAAKFMRKDINRQVFGDGTGLLANVSSALTTVKTTAVDSIQYLHVGDPVDVRLTTDGTAPTGGAANSVVALTGGSTKTVSFNTAVDLSGATIGIYVQDNRNQEMDGLRNIVATTRTLHTINSATAGNEFWNGNVRSVGTAVGSEQVAGETSFELISDDVGQTGQGETQAFVTTRGIRRRLAETFQSQKRFTNREAIQIHGGYSAIMVASGQGEVPVIIDDDCPKTWAFAIDNDALRWYQLSAPGYIGNPRGEGGGGIWHLKDGSTAGTKQAVWQAWMKWYAALGSHAPNRLGALKFCTDDVPTVTA
jgi:hypothetical protein